MQDTQIGGFQKYIRIPSESVQSKFVVCFRYDRSSVCVFEAKREPKSLFGSALETRVRSSAGDHRRAVHCL